MTAHETQWPTTALTVDANTIEHLQSELRKSESIFETALLPVPAHVRPLFGIEMSRYSTLLKLLRVTATCSLPLDIFKRQRPHQSTIQVGDLLEAQGSWDKFVQQTEFTELHRHLKQNQPDQTIRSLSLFLESMI